MRSLRWVCAAGLGALVLLSGCGGPLLQTAQAEFDGGIFAVRYSAQLASMGMPAFLNVRTKPAGALVFLGTPTGQFANAALEVGVRLVRTGRLDAHRGDGEVAWELLGATPLENKVIHPVHRIRGSVRRGFLKRMRFDFYYPMRFSLKIQKEGFRTVTIENVRLRSGNVDLSFDLERLPDGPAPSEQAPEQGAGSGGKGPP